MRTPYRLCQLRRDRMAPQGFFKDLKPNQGGKPSPGEATFLCFFLQLPLSNSVLCLWLCHRL